MSEQTETPDMDAETVATLRLRLERDDGLCLNEHTINQSDDSKFGRKTMWLTCGGEKLAARVFTWEELNADAQFPWAEMVMQRHRARVAERLVGVLLARAEVPSRKGADEQS